MSELANDKHNNKDIIKKDFNNYVAQAINNHETEPLFKTDGNSFVVDDKNYAFGQLDKKRAGNQVIKKLWESYVKKRNIKIGDMDTFELSLLSTKCILSDENKEKLYKLFNDAKKKALDEQEKKLDKEIIEKNKRNDIKRKLLNTADVLINNMDCKFKNNYIICGKSGDYNYKKYLLSSESTTDKMLLATSGPIRKKLDSVLDDLRFMFSCDYGVASPILEEVMESTKNKIKEKMASDIEKRKQVLKDFNDFVSQVIDKHSDKDKEVVYKYDYEEQKFYLSLDNKFYDTVDDLETALIKHYAKSYSESKNKEKAYNPFNPNPYSLNVDSIEVLDDITKRKLDNSVNMIFKDRLDELSRIFNSSCKSDVHKFISNLLGYFWIIEIDDRKKDRTIKEIKKVILKNFIEKLEGPDETKYHAIPYDFLGSVSISPIYLDYIFGHCLWGQFSRASNTQMGFQYYIENDIDSNNFDAKFDELKQEYGEKNISPVAACYFLSAIKKDDLTPERVHKVWNEVNTDLYHYLSTGTGNRLMTLVNNLLDGNFPSNEYLDIFIFCIRLDINFKYMDDNRLDDCLYNMIYGIITNSKEYKQANGNKEQEAVAIKNFFDLNEFSKKFWIALAELDANDNIRYRLFYSKNLTMRKMQELASNQKNKYSQKLNNLLQEHDIYISPTTEKIKDDKEKEFDQICIKVDSYKAIQTQAKKDFDEYMKKVIYDLKNDQNVEYDWAKGTLTYNEKIIYNFKEVEFYDEEGKKCDAADKTLQFVVSVTEFYCQDHKLPSYGFDLGLSPDDVREIQNIVGEKQQAKIKELIDGFSEFVDKKIEEYRKSKEILFMENNRLRIKVIDSPDSWSALDKSDVSGAAGACVEKCRCSYWKGKFYRSIRREEIDSDMYNNLTAKFKRLLNDKIGEYVKNNKLNYEYDEKNNYWKQIAEKNIEGKDKNSDENKNPEINLMEKTVIENKVENEQDDKIKDKITEDNKIQYENIDLNKTKKENKVELKKNDIIVRNKSDLIENDFGKQQESNEINTDENKNQNKIEIKNMKKNDENENGTKNDTSKKLSNQYKIVEGNDKINENTIQEASNNLKNQTLNSLDQNNPNESETKNKGWIKFLKVLKRIALIGFILALATTVTSIFVAALSDLIVKFAIAAVVLLCVFVVSKLLVSCLSNKKPKENESSYPKQINTGINTKENPNESNITEEIPEGTNINQMAKQEKNNSSFI